MTGMDIGTLSVSIIGAMIAQSALLWGAITYSLKGRLEGIEGRFEGIDGRFQGIDGRFDGLDTTIDTTREALETKLDGLAAVTAAQLAAVNHRLDHLEGDVDLIKRHLFSDPNAA